MAVNRGAGSEIIRTHMFEGVDDTVEKLIIGVQHHIYTVLSIIMRCVGTTGTEYGYLKMYGYDSNAGTTAQPIHLWRGHVKNGDTFIWNDKFSFNGHEPTDFTGPMDDTTKQDAIADQGSSVAQYLSCNTDSSSTIFDVVVTFVDQNNV